MVEWLNFQLSGCHGWCWELQFPLDSMIRKHIFTNIGSQEERTLERLLRFFSEYLLTWQLINTYLFSDPDKRNLSIATFSTLLKLLCH